LIKREREEQEAEKERKTVFQICPAPVLTVSAFVVPGTANAGRKPLRALLSP
jgi:hypothetical protein